MRSDMKNVIKWAAPSADELKAREGEAKPALKKATKKSEE